MELQTFFYTQNKNWSVTLFPALDSSQTLVIVFAAPEYLTIQEPLQQLKRAYPQSIIVGCSTGGEILGSEIMDRSIVVAVMKFKMTKLTQVFLDTSSVDGSFAAAVNIANQLDSKDLRGFFVLSDGLNVNGSELVKGFNSVFSEQVIVTGGLAADGDRFKHTWVIANGKIQSNIVVGVGFYGDNIRIGHGSKGGWYTFGQERIITKSKNNILYELDNKPALLLYKEYLGERAKGLPATGLLFPLSIRANRQDSKELVRTILAIDEATQSITFAGDMPTGYQAQLMRANFDRLVTAASDAAIDAAANQKNANPGLAIAISCIGRRLLLGEYTEEETEAALYSLPKGVQQIGFYSYGEISPYLRGYCDLHNQTMTITTLSEEL